MRYRTSVGSPKYVGGVGVEKLGGYIWYKSGGAVVADEPLLKKCLSLFGKMSVTLLTDSEGCYIEDVNNPVEDYNYPVVETLASNAATTMEKITVLSPTSAVISFIVATKLYVRPVIINSITGALSWGEAATVVNDAATVSTDICKISATEFACSYIDDGGSDYLCVRGGTLDSDSAITLGDEKELVSAASDKAAGTGIVLANTATMAIAYSVNSDGKGYIAACSVTSATASAEITFGTPGTAVEFDAGDNTIEINICSHTVGDVAVVYQAGGDTDDPITMCCATVSTANVVSCGDEVTMAGAAVVATGISCDAIGVDRVAFSWIDSTFLHVNMATIALTVPTKKTELQLTTTAALTSCIRSIDNNEVIIAYEDDANANDAGKVCRCSVSDTTWTKRKVSQFTHASTQTPTVGVLNGNEILLHYQDVGNTNKGKIMWGKWHDNVIDVRQETAAKPMRVMILPTPGHKRK